MPTTRYAYLVLLLGCFNIAFVGMTDPKLERDGFAPPKDSLQSLSATTLRIVIYYLSLAPLIGIPALWYFKPPKEKYPLVPYAQAILEVYAILLGGFNHFVMLIEYGIHGFADPAYPSDLVGQAKMEWLSFTIYSLASLAAFAGLAEIVFSECCTCKVTFSEA
jgi:hypothetical protein